VGLDGVRLIDGKIQQFAFPEFVVVSQREKCDVPLKAVKDDFPCASCVGIFCPLGIRI
jgi:hypothetical protein